MKIIIDQRFAFGSDDIYHIPQKSSCGTASEHLRSRKLILLFAAKGIVSAVQAFSHHPPI